MHSPLANYRMLLLFHQILSICAPNVVICRSSNPFVNTLTPSLSLIHVGILCLNVSPSISFAFSLIISLSDRKSFSYRNLQLNSSLFSRTFQILLFFLPLENSLINLMLYFFPTSFPISTILAYPIPGFFFKRNLICAISLFNSI